jgi:uncharacterized protein YbjT (DUF2867 family)
MNLEQKRRPAKGGADLLGRDQLSPYTDGLNSATSPSFLDELRARHVLYYVPAAEGIELELRIRLLMAQDHMSALRGRSSSWLGCELAHHGHDVAGRFVFKRGESLANLDLATQLCRGISKAALAADSLHCDESPL